MKKWKMVLLAVLAFVLTSWALRAMATPGAVDGNGCHKSKSAGIHCHPERVRGSAGGGAGGESQTVRDKRLKRECRGAVNAGACLGYTGRK